MKAEIKSVSVLLVHGKEKITEFLTYGMPTYKEGDTITVVEPGHHEVAIMQRPQATYRVVKLTHIVLNVEPDEDTVLNEPYLEVEVEPVVAAFTDTFQRGDMYA